MAEKYGGDPMKGYYEPFPDMRYEVPAAESNEKGVGGAFPFPQSQGLSPKPTNLVEIETDETNDLSDFGEIAKYKSDMPDGTVKKGGPSD